MKYLSTLFIFLYSLVSQAQSLKVPDDVYGLKNPLQDQGKACTSCMQVLMQKPADVEFGFTVQDNDIYFILTDSRWLELLFNKSYDGIAVDIVSRDLYSCKLKGNRANKHWAYDGYLMEPIYWKNFKKTALIDEKGFVFVKVGTIPDELAGKELEFNLLLISNKYVCHINTFFSVPWDRWGLLEMGLFMDTIPSRATAGAKELTSEKYQVFSKSMKFEVPFEKNKFEYAPSDIKALTDSLKLNDYEIKDIQIRAYSSVEGPEKINIELQEKRAESIIRILQGYQTEKINKDVQASENWVEFLEDISDSRFSYLKSLSKEEIKQKLEDKQLADQLEPVLKDHRKAILMINLEKKVKMGDDPEKLKASFEKAIVDKNIEEAKAIQEVIFSKMRTKSLPQDYMQSIKIPETYTYGSLLFEYAIFNYQENETDLYTSIRLFEKLQLLMPGNKNIRYNLTALKIRSWVYSQGGIDPEELRSEIMALQKMGIDQTLIKRMLINYHIIRSEYQISLKNYAEKDKSVKYIQTQYSTLVANENDALNLARYFSSYSKLDWAEKVLLKYVKKVDVNEDVLFYYLNLTIVDSKKTASQEYRTIMLNAININKERFCKIFNSATNGGITFQLLKDQYLKNMYCEGCEK
ncbi:hypothetical protein [Sporocytophaga myxococcoides]|uniref:hypothetical protein n=1 Tax=Sporocytophaga myxococcoides TaxID=153721 RepID=UPI0004145356|nr:hypothetical protein [Sporocytophaga myxococcoides]